MNILSGFSYFWVLEIEDLVTLLCGHVLSVNFHFEMRTNMSNSAKEKDMYTVTIVIGERAHFYPCFCSNHQEALEEAWAAHLEAGAPLPLGIRCLVYGKCHDTDCPCQGKDLGIDGVTSPEGFRVTNYCHV
jgi:hypothetical protein